MESSTNTSTHEQPVIIKDKARYWQQHMETWQASDLTQPAYCELHTISLAAFGYWRTRLKKQQCEDTKRNRPANPYTIPIIFVTHFKILRQ